MIIRGSTIRRLRIEAGLTQRELARLVGVSQAHIAKIENEKVDPRLSTVNKILNVLTGDRGLRCKDIMTKGVISVKPDDKISYVSDLMVKHAISQLPVIEDGRVIGTITEEDIVRDLSSTVAQEKVRKIMGPPLPTVSEDTETSVVKSLLERYPGVLVVREERIVGIITRSDLLKTVSGPL